MIKNLAFKCSGYPKTKLDFMSIYKTKKTVLEKENGFPV